MQKLRYQQMVRSTMVLSLTELISRIGKSLPEINALTPAPSGHRSAGKADNIPDAAETTLPYPGEYLAVYAQTRRFFKYSHKRLTGSHKINRFID